MDNIGDPYLNTRRVWWKHCYSQPALNADWPIKVCLRWCHFQVNQRRKYGKKSWREIQQITSSVEKMEFPVYKVVT